MRNLIQIRFSKENTKLLNAFRKHVGSGYMSKYITNLIRKDAIKNKYLPVDK